MNKDYEQLLLNVGYQPSLPFEEAKQLWITNVLKQHNFLTAYDALYADALPNFFEKKIWANNYLPKTQQQILNRNF